ncbi:hypothetical protein GUJ93_ZPchr0004g38586 [Zizania palustris]|uniref:Uncharacterized protein n=1 Tax=Zizania palustris TaxID=103762 RepID=A0A8J5SBP2_ZIZPA|nr:hypothetical protein GUJ93_ZPchr0004g38586 [Zizania palustris]
MGSIERQESIEGNGDLTNLIDDVFQEPLTLTSEEMDRARRGALEMMRNNTPEEALRIFSQVLMNNVESRPVVERRTEPTVNVAVPPLPLKSGDGEPKTGPPPPKN